MAEGKAENKKRELPPEMVEDVNHILDERERKKAEEKAQEKEGKSWFSRYWSDDE